MTTFLHRIAFCILTLVPISEISAQLQSTDRFGVYGGYNINFHTADFRALPGVPNCCPNYERGTGGGVALGALYEIAVSNKFWVTVRGGYSVLDATLIREEFVPAIRLSDGHYFADAAIEHRIKAQLSTIGIEPLITFNPIGGLRFHTGVEVASLSAINYDQIEEMTVEGLVFKENMRRTRNEFSGEMPNRNKIQAALVFGTSIELPINKNRSMFIVPEAMFHIGFSNLTQDVSWKANSFRIGLALKYAPQSVSLPAIENPAAPSDTLPPIVENTSTNHSSKTKEILKEQASLGSFEVFGVSDKGEQFPIKEIRVEEFISTQLKPLLPYIFFDANSAAIPKRYNILAPSDRSQFSLNQAGHSSTIEFYHQILNIVGKRMLENTDAVLKITGFNTEEEKESKVLSSKRAEKVKDYLVSVWNIPSRHIKIENRNLPTNASPTDDKEIAAFEAEMRRVELSSDNTAILAPVMSRDTIRSAYPRAARIIADYKNWSANIDSKGKIITTLSPSALNYAEWHPTEYVASLGESVTITGNGEATGKQKKIPIELYSLHRKESEQRADKTVDKYSLILFDFDRSDLSSQNKSIAEFVKSALTPQATVSIAGTTDQLGDAGYNRKLSLDRARATAAALGVQTVNLSGEGESEMYPNALPEGRFYNRTVVITVETPK